MFSLWPGQQPSLSPYWKVRPSRKPRGNGLLLLIFFICLSLQVGPTVAQQQPVVDAQQQPPAPAVAKNTQAIRHCYIVFIGHIPDITCRSHRYLSSQKSKRLVYFCFCQSTSSIVLTGCQSTASEDQPGWFDTQVPSKLGATRFSSCHGMAPSRQPDQCDQPYPMPPMLPPGHRCTWPMPPPGTRPPSVPSEPARPPAQPVHPGRPPSPASPLIGPSMKATASEPSSPSRPSSGARPLPRGHPHQELLPQQQPSGVQGRPRVGRTDGCCWQAPS